MKVEVEGVVWKARAVEVVVLGMFLRAEVRAKGRRSVNAMVEGFKMIYTMPEMYGMEILKNDGGDGIEGGGRWLKSEEA